MITTSKLNVTPKTVAGGTKRLLHGSTCIWAIQGGSTQATTRTRLQYPVTKVAVTGDSMHGVKTQSLARTDITVPDARPEADCSRLLAVQSRPEQHKSAVMALDQYLAASLVEQSTSLVLFPGRRRRTPLIAAAVTLNSKVPETARVTTSMSLEPTKRMYQISRPLRRLARLLPGYVNMEGRIIV